MSIIIRNDSWIPSKITKILLLQFIFWPILKFFLDLIGNFLIINLRNFFQIIFFKECFIRNMLIKLYCSNKWGQKLDIFDVNVHCLNKFSEFCQKLNDHFSLVIFLLLIILSRNFSAKQVDSHYLAYVLFWYMSYFIALKSII